MNKKAGQLSKQRTSPKKPSNKGKRSGKYDKDFIPLEHDLDSLRPIIAQGIESASYIVFDIETTGGNPEKNGITEICAFKYRHGKILDRFYSMVNPKVSIPPIVRRMTGINNKMVRDEPPIEEVMPSFLEFIQNDVLVSHNTIGDLKFIRHFAQTSCQHDLRNFFLCTHLLTEKLISESPDKSLGGLARYLGLSGGKAHRAEADALITKDLLAELLERLARVEINSVVDAIRFQGDLDSGMRLGWGIKDCNTKLPKQPGVLTFYSKENEAIFATSSYDCEASFTELSKFSTLPKQLLRTMLQSYRVEADTTHHIFTAMLAESAMLAEMSFKVEPHSWHMRSLSTICIVRQSEDSFKLKLGLVSPNTVMAVGPIFDRKEATTLLNKIAENLGLRYTRTGMDLSASTAEVVQAFFTDSLERQRNASVKSMLSFRFLTKKDWRHEVREKLSICKQLQEIGRPNYSNLLDFHGVLVIHKTPNENTIFPINGSVPGPPIDLAQDWEAWLYESRSGREFFEELKGLASPSTCELGLQAAYMCQAAIWVLASKKGRLPNRCSFLTLSELDARFGENSPF